MMKKRSVVSKLRGASSAMEWAVAWTLCGVLMGGCEDHTGSSGALPGNDNVLAEAEGIVVTEYDLDAYLVATIGDFGAARIDDEGRKKALEGLVATKVIAKRRDQELSASDRAELEKKVGAYREQLLVKQYLAAHAPPEPVTAAQIQSYYEENRERFAGRSDRDFEMLLSTEILSDTKRRKLLDSLAKNDDDDWSARAVALRAEGIPIHHRRGVMGRAPSHSKLDKTLRTMRVGRSSAPIFIQDKVYVLRVTGEKQHPKRTLPEASGEIRERLAPLQVRKAIARAKAKAMKDVQVTYR